MARLNIVHISGSGRNVGKTLLGEKLVEILTRRGYKVAAIKHVHHGVDYRVKDTGRYVAAGAIAVIAIGPNELMIVQRHSTTPIAAALILARLGVNVVIIEGFRDQTPLILAAGGCAAYIQPNHIELWTPKPLAVGLIDEAATILYKAVERGSCVLGAEPIYTNL